MSDNKECIEIHFILLLMNANFELNGLSKTINLFELL